MILLNDQEYREYKITYDTNLVELVSSHEFVPATEAQTEAPAYEPETVAEQQYYEDVTVAE